MTKPLEINSEPQHQQTLSLIIGKNSLAISNNYGTNTWDGGISAPGRQFVVGPQDRVEVNYVQPAKLRAATSLIDEYASLQPNWNSYGAAMISSSATSAARRMLSRFFADRGDPGLPSTIVPLADGGIQFEWEKAGGTLELEIQADGTLHALLIRHALQPENRGEITWSEARELLTSLLD